jgi:hypothetical protein
LSTFFTTPDSSVLELAEVPSWPDELWLVDVWLDEGDCAIDESLELLFVAEDSLDVEGVVEDWLELDGLVLAVDELDGLVLVVDELDGLVAVEDWLELDGLVVAEDWVELDGVVLAEDCDELWEDDLSLSVEEVRSFAVALPVMSAAAAAAMRNFFMFSPPVGSTN